MKNIFVIIVAVAAGIVAGALMEEVRRQRDEGRGMSDEVIDTVHYYDTIPYYQPAAKQEVSLGTKITFLPVFKPRDSVTAPVEELSPDDKPVSTADSVAVEIPITQRYYADSAYRAWISGYDPRLDSIMVFPRRDVITIREPAVKPKRWGIGIFAGYGMTPQGLQPCAGISINYNILMF